MKPELAAAARNNAVWCDTICRAHGRPGEFLPGLWLARGPAPRFYPNAVTLAGGSPAAQLAAIGVLGQAGLPPGWAVKDSFHALDLAPLGFRVLFAAEWLWRPAALPPPTADWAGARWARVRSAPELAQWEMAWGTAPGQARMFPPRLLADPALAFLAAQGAEGIAAVAIANQSDGVVGLSNVFGPDGHEAGFWAGAIAATVAAFPGQPLVGYEQGADLAAAQAGGFMSIGPLRVWLSEA